MNTKSTLHGLLIVAFLMLIGWTAEGQGGWLKIFEEDESLFNIYPTRDTALLIVETLSSGSGYGTLYVRKRDLQGNLLWSETAGTTTGQTRYNFNSDQQTLQIENLSYSFVQNRTTSKNLNTYYIDGEKVSNWSIPYTFDARSTKHHTGYLQNSLEKVDSTNYLEEIHQISYFNDDQNKIWSINLDTVYTTSSNFALDKFKWIIHPESNYQNVIAMSWPRITADRNPQDSIEFRKINISNGEIQKMKFLDFSGCNDDVQFYEENRVRTIEADEDGFTILWEVFPYQPVRSYTLVRLDWDMNIVWKEELCFDSDLSDIFLMSKTEDNRFIFVRTVNENNTTIIKARAVNEYGVSEYFTLDTVFNTSRIYMNNTFYETDTSFIFSFRESERYTNWTRSFLFVETDKNFKTKKVVQNKINQAIDYFVYDFALLDNRKISSSRFDFFII